MAYMWPDGEPHLAAKLSGTAPAAQATLADLYDPDNAFLYTRLTKAHDNLDRAVEAAYEVNFNGDEQKIVAHLFTLYSRASTAR